MEEDAGGLLRDRVVARWIWGGHCAVAMRRRKRCVATQWALRQRCRLALAVVAMRWASRQRCRVALAVVATRSGANLVDAAGHP